MSLDSQRSKSARHDEMAQAYKNSTILVSGGAGFIGSNLVRRLLDLDVHKVVVLDDLSSSFAWNLPRDNRIQLIRGSILDNEKLASAFETCLLYTSPSPRDLSTSRMPSSA